MQLTHTPGWKFTIEDQDPNCLTVFSSDTNLIGYTLDLFTDTGSIHNSIEPTIIEWSDLTTTELNQLATDCTRLRQWFTDLATVTQWAHDHTQEIMKAIRSCS